MRVVGGLTIAFMAALYVLLALQAEPVTATLGYIFAGLLVLSLVRHFTKGGNDA